MAKKREKVPNPLTAQRKAEIAKETEAALASARKSESDRVARVGAAGVKGTERKAVEVDANPGVSFKKVDEVTARVSGEEDQGPSAAPKPKLKGTLVSTGKKMRQKGLRPAKNRELNKGVMAVTVANETPAPKPARKGAKKTKTGKKLNPKTGKIDVSKIKPGQAGKIDKTTVVRVTPENVEEVKKTARTTFLEPTKPEVEKPTYELPGAPQTVKEQGYSQSNPEHHERLKSLTGKAFLHLNRMQSTHGTDEYHSHHADFNETHAHVAQLDHSMGEILKMAHTAASNPKHPDSPKQFAYAKQAAGERLGLGKKTMDARTERSQAGRAKRMERIRAEQAAKEGQ
jgi:hypothetical protein